MAPLFIDLTDVLGYGLAGIVWLATVYFRRQIFEVYREINDER